MRYNCHPKFQERILGPGCLVAPVPAGAQGSAVSVETVAEVYFESNYRTHILKTA